MTKNSNDIKSLLILNSKVNKLISKIIYHIFKNIRYTLRDLTISFLYICIYILERP